MCFHLNFSLMEVPPQLFSIKCCVFPKILNFIQSNFALLKKGRGDFKIFFLFQTLLYTTLVQRNSQKCRHFEKFKKNLTEGCVIISSSSVKQLSTDKATDWNNILGHPSGLSLLRNILARNE